MARRHRPEVAPFAGLADETSASYQALRELLQPGDQVMFPSLAAVPDIDGLCATQVGPGFTEITAVCVDDAWRGRGIAAGLIGALRAQIEQRGEAAFLHVVTGNRNAIALYERLGFEARRTLFLNLLSER